MPDGAFLALPDGPWRCRIAGRCRPVWAMPAVRRHCPVSSPHVTWRCRLVLALPAGAVPVRRPQKFSNRGSVRSAQNMSVSVANMVTQALVCNLRDVSIVVTNRVGQRCKLWELSQPQVGSRRSEPFQLRRAGRVMHSCIPCASFPTSPFSMVVANVPRGSFGPRG